MDLFERLKAYVDFSADDEANIASLAAMLDRRGREIMDRFYGRILATPATRAVLQGGEQQVARLKETFRVWLGQLVLGPHDRRYFEMRSRIGRRHVAVGLPSEYMFAAMNVMRTVLTEIIHDEVADSARAMAIVISVGKILDLELAVMLDTYQEDLIEKWRTRDREAIAERLGSLEATAAGLAHEIGNPLNSVSIHLNLLARKLEYVGTMAAEEAMASVETIRESVGRLERIVREFQDYSRGVDLRLRPLNLGDEIERLARGQAAVAAEHRVDLDVEIPVRPLVNADADRLNQVFLNIVTNAYEAMPEGGRLRIAVEHDGPEACALFSDSGPGIPPEEQMKIFGMFYSTKPRGTGLGLAISERIVHGHGGRIILQSKPGAGSTFGICLPMLHS